MPLNIFIKFLILLNLFLLILSTLRIFLWPINWDDQIYYIEQAYAIGQERSLKTFRNWDTFDNGLIRFNSNPAIRPALPLLYAYPNLFTDNVSSTVKTARIFSYYYILISIITVFYLSKKLNTNYYFENGLAATFLIYSSYLFVNHAVMGFKELPLLCLIILFLDYLNTENPKFFYMGLLLGLMSYINLSGTLISCILLLISFFKIDLKLKQKTKFLISVLIALIIFSGFEFIYFFTWTLSGGTKTFSITKYIDNTPQSLPVINTSYQKNEFRGYNINNFIDVYTKGKLQGLFQPQFYGLIFHLFLFVLIFRFKQLWTHPLSKLLLIFIGLYYLILIDLFGLNRQQYAYVTTVSHKYTVMMIPLISLLIGQQWFWFKNVINLIKPSIIFGLSIFIFCISIIFSLTNGEIILYFISKLIPIHNSLEYYRSIINLGMYGVIFISFTICLLLIILYKYYRFFKSQNIAIYLFSFFFLPYLFFFNTNFGLENTLFHSLAPITYKMANIPGWENLYLMINKINTLPENSNLLFYSQPYQLMALYLKFPSKQIILLNNTDNHKVNKYEVEQTIYNKSIDYLLVGSEHQIDTSNKYLLYSTDNRLLYMTNFSN